MGQPKVNVQESWGLQHLSKKIASKIGFKLEVGFPIICDPQI